MTKPKQPKKRRGTKTPMAKRVLALDAPLTSLADDQVLTFVEWCQLNRISERTGRRILDGPDAPTVTMLSPRRIGVTVRANREWQSRSSPRTDELTKLQEEKPEKASRSATTRR